MLDEPFWYWLLVAFALLLFAGPFLLYKWEARQNRRDRETWERIRRGAR